MNIIHRWTRGRSGRLPRRTPIRLGVVAVITAVAVCGALASSAAAESDGTRYYAFKNRNTTDRYLAASGVSDVVVAPESSSDTQLWRWMATPVAGMQLKNKATGRCLDLQASYTGAPVVQRSCAGFEETQGWLTYWEATTTGRS